MVDDAKTFLVEDARLVFKNFKGAEGQFNREGDRNFSVVLDPVAAEQMEADGWNVKYLASREEGEDPTPIIEVSVKFKVRPPRIVLITTDTRTQLSEKEVEVLDYADIKTVDVFCRGYEWEVNDKRGIKAYLQTMMVTIHEDPLERKYKVHENPPHHSED